MERGMSVTVTFYAWWVLVYLAVGVVLFFPLNYLAWRHTVNPRPFWHEFRRNWTRRWYVIPATVVLWPLALWEEVR